VDRSRVQIVTAAFLAVVLGVAPRVLRVQAAPPVKAATAAASASANDDALIVAGKSCPPGTLPDDGACVTLPVDESFGEDPVGAPEGEPVANGHWEKSGKWTSYEQIPRRPDRPADYDAYVYPIPPGLPGGHYVVSGYDLDLPDALQRHGKMRAVGHGGVDIPQKKGTPIQMLALDHQVGDALVLHVGLLMGLSVVTLHTVREGGRTRQYVLIHGHIDHAAAGLKRGDVVKPGTVIAYVGDTGSPELVHLHLEARRVRDGVEGESLVPGRILAADATIVCDPRNVLQLKGDPAQPK
jgi:murein DD-endopeptidase MepM/ murein hydrolase activator NlpD